LPDATRALWKPRSEGWAAGLTTLLLLLAHAPVQAQDTPSIGLMGQGVLETVTTIVELAVLTALWVAFARGPAERGRFLRYAAACVCAFVVFGKVLSPQYLIWLVPLVALVRGSRGLAAAALLASAMVTTQYWFAAPRYEAYARDYSYAELVLLRDLMLVALLAALAFPRTIDLMDGRLVRSPELDQKGSIDGAA